MDESAEPDPLIGRTVADGRYEVLARLGTGGMGTVYRVRQHPLERMAVLKLIHREMASDATAVGRFEREMRVTAAIEHPHTVRVYDFGQIDGQPFLAMEYLAGRSLRQTLDRGGALPAERVASIGVQVAKALGAAHRVGVVHRDLKPDNIMLVDGYGERDFVKVLDFGIARSLDQGGAGFRTKVGAIIGTPAYMSPEQASNVPLDARSDLYSLGVVLYEALSGSPPFVGESITALLYAHASVAPPPLPPRVPRPPGLEAAIFRLLSKDPAMRPASADETIDLLAPFAGASITSTRPPRRRRRDDVRVDVDVVDAGPFFVDDGAAPRWNDGAVAAARGQGRRPAPDPTHRAVAAGGGPAPAFCVNASRGRGRDGGVWSSRAFSTAARPASKSPIRIAGSHRAVSAGRQRAALAVEVRCALRRRRRAISRRPPRTWARARPTPIARAGSRRCARSTRASPSAG